MSKCNACWQPGHGGMRCEQARRIAEHALTVNTIDSDIKPPVNTKPTEPDAVVNTKPSVNTKRKGDRHKPCYMRDYMAKRRNATDRLH